MKEEDFRKKESLRRKGTTKNMMILLILRINKEVGKVVIIGIRGNFLRKIMCSQNQEVFIDLVA